MTLLRPVNTLLAALPAETLLALEPRFTTIALTRRQVLHREGERIRDVYFPNGGLVIMATVLADGATVEAATIGDEGVVGIGALFSESAVSPFRSMVEVATTGTTARALRIADFRSALTDSPELREALCRYAGALYARISRLTACNVRHDVHQRCARWLLGADDRLNRVEFSLSHGCLAATLGVRRQTVGEVVRAFRRDGLIRYARSGTAILDRAALERRACECYRVLARTYSTVHAEIRRVSGSG